MSLYQIISICQRTINILNCAQEGVTLISKQVAVKKKCVFVSTLRPQQQNTFGVSLKLCLNLCSRNWLRPRRSLVRYLVPLQLWQLKTQFGDGLINFNKFFKKTLRLAALWRLGSNLKNLCLAWNGVILSVFLVL